MNPFDNIKNEDLPEVINGYAENIPQLFDKLIKPQFENTDTIKEIHHSLIEYINCISPIFFIRLYGSYSRNNYHLQRRGFLTKYNDNFKVVFCDNTFTLLFTGMKLNDISYSSSDLIKLFNQKKLIVGFGQVSQERELCFYSPKGASRANLNSKGWYQAHIKPTGYGYDDLDIKTLFPNPPRNEFFAQDRARYLNENLSNDQQKILKAHFLRLIHPFNSFLVPKRSQLSYSGKNIGEENELISFVRSQLKNSFPLEYDEFNKLSIDFNFEESSSSISNIKWFGESKGVKGQISLKTEKVKLSNLKKVKEKELNESDSEIKLETTLRAIGKGIFATVLYPELIKNFNVSFHEIASKHSIYENFTTNSQRSRLSKAKSIFKDGEETEALMNIYESKKIKSEIKAHIFKHLNKTRS